MKKRSLAAAICLALGTAHQASAVYLNADGLGQALIYPHYTVRFAGGNAFNTYLSVANRGLYAKVARARFREGVNHRAVANFNLSTCPAGDMWAATLVPTADGAKVITGDTACVNPPFTPSPGAPRELAFSVRDVQTDQTLTYASRVLGLPVVGFMVAYAPQRQPVLRECDLPG